MTETIAHYGSGYLAHYGVKGMKWGVWNQETRERYDTTDRWGPLDKTGWNYDYDYQYSPQSVEGAYEKTRSEYERSKGRKNREKDRDRTRGAVAGGIVGAGIIQGMLTNPILAGATAIGAGLVLAGPAKRALSLKISEVKYNKATEELVDKYNKIYLARQEKAVAKFNDLSVKDQKKLVKVVRDMKKANEDHPGEKEFEKAVVKADMTAKKLGFDRNWDFDLPSSLFETEDEKR